MTMMLTSVCSMIGLSEEVLLTLLTIAVTFVLSYIFYPAISLSLADSIAIQEETVSSTTADSQSVLLSIIIPAYNEQERLPNMLNAATTYVNDNRDSLVQSCQEAIHCNDTTTTSIEWIVVSDGSTDDTPNVVRRYGRDSKRDTWGLVSLMQNSGKGAAVKAGMLRARGALRLMVDADGATDFGEGIERVLKEISLPNQQVVFGSRAYLQEQSAAQRSWIRTALMHAFHLFVQLLCSSQVQDTQCGFKLFCQDAALLLFENLHLRRWAFDTELVVLAEKCGFSIQEVAVPWHEVDGSKLDTSKLALVRASVEMLRDMMCVRACYSLRLWQVKQAT